MLDDEDDAAACEFLPDFADEDDDFDDILL